MKAHVQDLECAPDDPLLQDAYIKNGFRITRWARSKGLSLLYLDHAASILDAGGKLFSDSSGQRYRGSVVLTDARAIRRTLDHHGRQNEWRSFSNQPLQGYLSRIAELETTCRFPKRISARGGLFFAETLGRNTLISCGITGWPNEPNYPEQQLALERAATLGAAPGIRLPELMDNDHTTLKIARFPEGITPHDVNPIVHDLNTAAETVKVAVHLLQLTYLVLHDA